MGKEQQIPEIYPGSYESIEWLIGGEIIFRWDGGPQFGRRMVSRPFVTDLEGKKHPLPAQHGATAWYDWRFRRVNGLIEKFSPPLITLCLDEEETTIGIELEGRPDVVTPHT